MHELYSTSPRAELRPYVRAFAQRKISGAGGKEFVQPIPAGLEQTVEFEFGEHPIVEFGDGSFSPTYQVGAIGPSVYRPANIHLRDGIESFAIFFQPLAFWQLFRVPLDKLANHNYDCRDVVGVGILELRDRMAEMDSFFKRVQFVEEYLLKKIANPIGTTPIMNAAHYMFERRGILRISDIADEVSLSLRQFERRFADEIGVRPKLFARIARFQAVLDTKVDCSETAWLTLAHRFGYHDQMHMIRDFHGLSGFSPERLLERIGDMRPPALAARGKKIR